MLTGNKMWVMSITYKQGVPKKSGSVGNYLFKYRNDKRSN